MSRQIQLLLMVVAATALAACPKPTAQQNQAGNAAALIPTGGVCANASSCTTPGDFCKKPIGTCTTPGTQGVCTRRPPECPYVNDPVCGCDGKTYFNEQCADYAGVNVRAKGECPPEQPQGVAMPSVQIVPEIRAGDVKDYCRLAERPDGKDLIVRLRNPTPLNKPAMSMIVGFTPNSTVQTTTPVIPGADTVDVKVPVPGSCLTGDCRFLIRVQDPAGGVKAEGNCLG